MAEGLLRHLTKGRVDVYSAGRAPSSVNPYAKRAMRARGIDIGRQRSEHLDRYREREFNYVITVCDRAAECCPLFLSRARRIHWSFPDPAAVAGDDAAVLQSFIAVRDGLESKLKEWLKTAI